MMLHVANSTHIPTSAGWIRPAASPPGKRPEILPPEEAPGHVPGPAWQHEHEQMAPADAASQAVTEADTCLTSSPVPEPPGATSSVILAEDSSTSSQEAPFTLTVTIIVTPTTTLVDPAPSTSSALMPKLPQPAEAELSSSTILTQLASITPLPEEKAASPDPHVGAIVGSVLGGIALGLLAAIVVILWLAKGRRPRAQFVQAA